MSEISPSKISSFCESIIGQYIGVPIKISPESLNPYESRYSLVSGIKSDFTTPSIAFSDRGDRILKVFPLFLSRDIKDFFWIYFSIVFNVDNISKKAKYSFDGVSLQVFKGIATDENKQLLFRAEWDCKKDNTIHPHPHWHIHFIKEQLPLKVTENFDAFLELADEETKDFLSFDTKPQKNTNEFNISKFHFAMGASWSPVPNDKFQLEEASLKGWLSYTLKHIKEQLEYAAS